MVQNNHINVSYMYTIESLCVCLSESARNLACAILIPSEWSWAHGG